MLEYSQTTRQFIESVAKLNWFHCLMYRKIRAVSNLKGSLTY